MSLNIRPGGTNGAMPMDAGLLKASRSSDAKLLDCEFTVVEGPFARRKFWQMFTVSGGKLDDKGQSKGWNISKATFRAMIDSALGLDPRDESPGAKQKRVLQGLKQLDGIVFAARVMVEPSSDPQYKDGNKLANVVLPDEPAHGPVMRGEIVPADPVKARARKQQPAGSQAPGWNTAPPVTDKPWTAQPTNAASTPPSLSAPSPTVSKPIYFAQLQLYMAYMELEAALLTVLNKDSQELHHEFVTLDVAAAQALSDKAVDVIRAAEIGELPPRIAASPDFYLCRWCPYARRCWGDPA